MAETTVATENPAPATGTKKAARQSGGAAKKPKAIPTHPKTSEMVNSAIKEMNERSGSSLQAIKKYIADHYKVDAEKLAPFIRKYLKSAVESGALIQTKCNCASKGEAKKATASATATKKAASMSQAKGGTAPKAKKTATKRPTKKPKAPKPKKAAAAPKSKLAAKKTVAAKK